MQCEGVVGSQVLGLDNARLPSEYPLLPVQPGGDVVELARVGNRRLKQLALAVGQDECQFVDPVNPTLGKGLRVCIVVGIDVGLGGATGPRSKLVCGRAGQYGSCCRLQVGHYARAAIKFVLPCIIGEQALIDQ